MSEQSPLISLDDAAAEYERRVGVSITKATIRRTWPHKYNVRFTLVGGKNTLRRSILHKVINQILETAG